MQIINLYLKSRRVSHMCSEASYILLLLCSLYPLLTSLSLTLPSLSSLCSDSLPLSLSSQPLSLPTLLVSISLFFLSLSLSNWHGDNVYGGGMEIAYVVEVWKSWKCVGVMWLCLGNGGFVRAS